MRSNFKKKELRDFGLLVGSLFPIIIGFLLPLLTGHDFKDWTIFPGIILIIFALFKPSYLYYPYKFWMRAGHIMGIINSNLILGIVFVFVLQPISIFMKFIGYDPLNIKKQNCTSYRKDREELKIDLRKIF